MVFLFGWMTNFVLFSGITKQLHVFLMVLKEVIIKDMILNFSLVFIFTVIAFACTMHAMRMIIVSHEQVGLHRKKIPVYPWIFCGEFFSCFNRTGSVYVCIRKSTEK